MMFSSSLNNDILIDYYNDNDNGDTKDNINTRELERTLAQWTEVNMIYSGTWAFELTLRVNHGTVERSLMIIAQA